MGCVSSSSQGVETAKPPSGSNKKPENAAGNADDIYDKPPMNDPRVPLTRREIFLAGKSWKGVTRNMEETGMHMINKLIKQNPEFEEIIKSNAKEEDKDNALCTTADSMMSGFSKSILLLEDYDKFVDFLFALGNSYRQFHNFNDTYFEKLREPFLSAIRETLQDRYTDNIQNIYTKAFNFIVQTMKEGYNSSTRSHLGSS
ncbi:unnamed protein product [Gordionus sp. m RMFG-2023]|uniref:uncharacterized protein LOC135928312 n=1 Tax=Gordionus sp. m RMFG-2023 TaxID=3053472 RepID=UPI0030E5A47D